ncbi:MAG: nucleotidyltransferase domain-containing protein [Bacteroidales bacterium]|jgi:predicted nucleotidyltransferase|nr:nucleotidyltransferase domain-containing protein [Bacteroidales bacterium]
MYAVTIDKEMIAKICKEHNVENMYLFGSVLTNNFAQESDIDCLVSFGEVNLYDYFNNYIALKEALEVLFKRPVDLVEEKTIKNPILRRSIDRNKKLIYG